MIVASECAAGLHPQNSLSGFRYCVDNAVDGIEFDVHLSADGEVVVQHDYRLNPDITRDARGQWLQRPTAKLIDLTLPEIRAYNIGRYRAGSYPAQTYPHYTPQDHEPIPTLEDFTDVFKANAQPDAQLWLELKTSPLNRAISSDPDKLLDAVLSRLSAASLIERTVLLAFEWDLLGAAKQLVPSISTDFLSLSTARMQSLYPKLPRESFQQLFGRFAPDEPGGIAAAVAAARGEWWGPLIHDVCAEEVRAAQELGVRVNVWGVGSTQEELDQVLALGADAITVARPDLARSHRDAIRGPEA